MMHMGGELQMPMLIQAAIRRGEGALSTLPSPVPARGVPTRRRRADDHKQTLGNGGSVAYASAHATRAVRTTFLASAFDEDVAAGRDRKSDPFQRTDARFSFLREDFLTSDTSTASAGRAAAAHSIRFEMKRRRPKARREALTFTAVRAAAEAAAGAGPLRSADTSHAILRRGDASIPAVARTREQGPDETSNSLEQATAGTPRNALPARATARAPPRFRT